MSRIDTAKLQSGSNSGVSTARIQRALSRSAAPLPSEASIQQGLIPAVQPFRHDRAIEQHETALPSIAAISDADLSAISGMGTEQLSGELCRIDVLLKDAKLGLDDPDMQQAFEIGSAMLGESIRRLRLVQTGQDSLILKR